MDVNGLLNMYRGNFLSQAEEFDGYIQKAKVATCKEKYTLAKAFRKFKLVLAEKSRGKILLKPVG